MRIWCQKISSGKDAKLIGFLKKNFELTKNDDTYVEIAIVKRSVLGEHFVHRYFNFLNNREIIEGIIQAEQAGYDAVIINCFYDPCLKEAREIANIPVVGPAESSMLLASTMCSKFAIITLHPKAKYLIEENIGLYGMEDRVIKKDPVRSLTLSVEQQHAAIANPKTILEDFVNVARGCLEDGAELLIPGCTLTSPILQVSGLREIDGAPILECLTAALKMAEMLVDIKKAGLPWISRKGIYSSPGKDLISRARELISYEGPGSEIIM